MTAQTGVLVVPGWPLGVCPVHMFGRSQCTALCLPDRRELLVIQHDYDCYWRDKRREHARTAAPRVAA